MVAACLSGWLVTQAVPGHAQTSSNGWSVDIGHPDLPGRATYSGGGVFTVEAAGAGIWGVSDQFHFAYQQRSDDFDYRARVDSLTAVSPWSMAGLMVRSNLSGGAAHGYALVFAGGGSGFLTRPSAGGPSAYTPGPTVHAPRWLRLVRTGALLTAYTSADGASWTTIGSDAIALGASVYVGFAVTSLEPAVRTTARFSAASIALAGLPPGQTGSDIGAPAIRGTSRFADGVYTIGAGGSDIWGTRDEFHFVHLPIQGDVTITARVASVTRAHHWSKAGVMIRESLDSDSRHAYALVSAGRGTAFQRRSTTGGASEHTAGPPANAPGWVRLVRTGSIFEAFHSPDGQTWTRIGSRAVGMTGTVYVGIAVTSRNVWSSTTAIVDSFQISQEQPPVNQPPAVSLTAPADGAVYTAPGPIALSAQASDADGTIQGVDFMANGVFIGSKSTAPYSLAWEGVSAGTYVITAVATDNAGATTTSAGRAITVSPVVLGPPTGVVFAASLDHVALVTSYLLEVYAAGATPGTSTPVATSDLGKPQPASNGDISVGRSAVFEALASGSYIATVAAVGTQGMARSTAVSVTR